jgi:ATP-dependent Clp protease ATP-binding subunit ClpC
MGARPLRRAIQRYIEDPLADEVLKASDMVPGATVEVDAVREPAGEDGKEKDAEVKISIKAPERKREAVGVGAKGDGGELPEGSDLPDDPEVLPDVPDAPPAAEGEAQND